MTAQDAIGILEKLRAIANTPFRLRCHGAVVEFLHTSASALDSARFACEMRDGPILIFSKSDDGRGLTLLVHSGGSGVQVTLVDDWNDGGFRRQFRKIFFVAKPSLRAVDEILASFDREATREGKRMLPTVI